MVMSIPKTKQTASSNVIDFCFDRPEPTWVPIGVMAMSAPRLKKPMPSTRSTGPTVKPISSLLSKEILGNREIIYTSNVMGSAETSASRIFDYSSFI